MIRIPGVTIREGKKGTSYRIRVFVGTDAQGKKIHAVETWRPPKPDLSESKLNKLLLEEKARFEAEVKSGHYSPSRMTVAEFIPQFLELIGKDHSPTTVHSYKRVCEAYILPALGHRKMREITPLDVQKFVQQLENLPPADRTGKREAADSARISPATVKRYYCVLQSLLGHACKLGLIAENPANSARITLPRQTHEKVETFSPEEMNQIFSGLMQEKMKYQVIVYLAFITGARRGELCALKWENIHLEGDQPYIDILLSSYKLPGEEVHTKEPKSETSRRPIAIPEDAAALLVSYRREQMKQADKMGDMWKNREGWLFTTFDGEPMDPGTVSRWWPKFLDKNSIPRRKFHAIRHTSATIALESGGNIKAVSARLGHAQLSTTNIYLHGTKTADAAIADSLGGLIPAPATKKAE